VARGSLRIYLGAAPGVGKTYKMLGEGVRRQERGTDVVIGVVETHGRLQTAEQIRDLELIPLRQLNYRGATLKEMDVDTILARKPSVVLVDEYAHTNVPGSRNQKRWQDVEELLKAGIDVISTVNIQHLESVNDVITRITGVVQRETVPDAVVRRADQIELVDMAPEAIRRRLAHGNIYPAERIDAALSNYFRPGNLGALRELALLWVADRVEESLQSYLDVHGIADSWETRERVVVGITGRPGGEALIRRASRMAGRVRGDLVGVHVAMDDGLSTGNDEGLAAQRQLVVELGGTVHDIVGHDAADTLVSFARREKATQLVLGASRRSRWQEIFHGSFVARVTRLAGGIDVHVIHTEEHDYSRSRTRKRRPWSVAPRRLAAAWILTVLGLPLVVAVMLPFRDHLAISTVLLTFLTVVLAIAAIGGVIVGATAAVVASLLVNWYFVPPYYTLTIAEAENAISLIVFVVVAVTVGSLVVAAARRSREAKRARLEAGALTRSATMLATDPDPIPGLLAQGRSTFQLDGVRIVSALGSDSTPAVSVGDVAGSPSLSMPIQGGAVGSDKPVLEVFGRPLSNDDQELLRVLADQLAVALQKGRMAAEAAEADALVQIDAVRTGLLRSVSHDLRTPLAGIKAMISGLRDPTITWREDQIAEAHATIEEEADRLNRLVGNLLDASRLEIGAVAVDLRPTSVAATIASAVQSAEVPPGSVVVASTEPDLNVMADAMLLERSLDNVISNAVRHSDSTNPVRIDAAAVNDEVHICVVDRGPGIAVEHRSRVVQPFQRLGDQAANGVGLGLSIAQGFVQAMGGTFALDDTPGGGLTVTVVLPQSNGAFE